MGNRGFTLVELMIAVVIIVILAGVALPRMGTAVRAAIEARTKANLNAVRTALAAYYGDRGTYPADHLGDLVDKGYLPRGVPMIWEPPYHGEGNGVCVGTFDVDTMVGCTDAYLYDNNPTDAAWGQVILSCIHTDLKGRAWSSY